MEGFLLDPEVSVSGNIFTTFISRIEGWKTRCKNLHWAAPRKNIHVYLDEFLDIMSDYQDALAEDSMGITGKMEPNIISGIPASSINAWAFIDEVLTGTTSFYNSIPEGTVYAGIRSETETFIHNILKYKYLFSLCGEASKE